MANLEYRDRIKSGSNTLDEIITRVTGKALPGQKAIFNFGGVGWWLISTFVLFGLWFILGLEASFIPTAGPWIIWHSLALIIIEVAVVGRLRAQSTVFGHHAVHGTLSSRWPMVNSFVKHFAMVISCAQNPSDYRQDHVSLHHRWSSFTTHKDPDASFLYMLGFRSGMSRRRLYKKLWSTFFSPRFHWLLLCARVRSMIWTAGPLHRIIGGCWITALMIISIYMPWWMTMLTIILPLGPLYHISALLQFLTEHRWLATKDGPQNKEDYALRCIGRFSLIQPPPESLNGFARFKAWTYWSFRMIPEILVRLGVWVGDLPAHDHHHLIGHLRHQSHDWDKALFERQRSIDEGDPAALASREAYGLKAALDWVFDGLSTAEE